MARHPWLDPSAFIYHGVAVGVLLIHGFTSTPTEMRLLGAFLAEHGYAVSAPLLPGHGTEPADLNRQRWQDWVQEARRAYQDLASRTAEILVGGQSMGALIALQLAIDPPPATRSVPLRGLILFAPGLLLYERRLPLTIVGRFLVPHIPKQEEPVVDVVDPEAFNRYWCYESYPVAGGYQLWRLQREVRSRLAVVGEPLIVFMGKEDRAVRPESAYTILSRVGSADKQIIWLEHSGHGITVDAERELVFQHCLEWMQAHAGDPQNRLT
jgi:carboxylesterase